MINMQNVRPKYEVETLEGTVTEDYYERDMEKGMNVKKTREVPAGFMVYFPNGNSIRVRDEEELERLGFNDEAYFIDMESGEEVQMQTSLKKKVQRRSTASKKPAHTASKDAS